MNGAVPGWLFIQQATHSCFKTLFAKRGTMQRYHRGIQQYARHIGKSEGHMASPVDVNWASASVSQLSNVYCSKTLLDNAVFGATILAGCGGGCMTCLVAAHFAASFHIVPLVVFSACCLANGSVSGQLLVQKVAHSRTQTIFAKRGTMQRYHCGIQ